MDAIGVIPARYESTRLPHKLLKSLCGKPLLQWTWESARRAALLDKVIIACDDPRIKEVGEAFGAECLLTSRQHPCGTDRVAEAVNNIEAQVVVNIQADEPLIHASVITDLARTMLADKDLVMATVKTKIDNKVEINNPNVVKVVCSKDGFALYFSRFPIPYYRGQEATTHYKHLGIYAYSKEFLYTLKNMPPSSLEEAEKLEQLRVLEAGYQIKVIETQFDSWGVDTQEDFDKVARVLEERSAPAQ